MKKEKKKVKKVNPIRWATNTDEEEIIERAWSS